MPMTQPFSTTGRRPMSCFVIKRVFMNRQKSPNVRIQAFGQHRNRLGIQNLCRQHGGSGVKVGALMGCYYLHTATANCARLVSAKDAALRRIALPPAPNFKNKSNRHARQVSTCWKFQRSVLCPCSLSKTHDQLRLEKRLKKGWINR